jgi:hypothetical protein
MSNRTVTELFNYTLPHFLHMATLSHFHIIFAALSENHKQTSWLF